MFRSEGLAETQDYGGASVAVERLCYVSKGMVLHSEDPDGRAHFAKDDLISDVPDARHPKRFMEGKHMAKWVVRRLRYLEYGTKRAPALCSRPTFPEIYEVPEKLIAMDISGGEARVAHDDRQLFHNHSAWSFAPWHSLAGVRNRSIQKTARYRDEVRHGETPPGGVFREELEELSRQFALKYVLAVMNSTFARDWLATRRRSKIHVYPDDWKPLPIAPIPLEEQQHFVKLVDAILAEFATHGYPLPAEAATRVAELEREIDERVAGLYGPSRVLETREV